MPTLAVQPQSVETGQSPEALTKHVKQVTSEDGAVSFDVSTHGAQVLRAEVNGRKVILPLDGLHSVVFNDPRPNGNPSPMGETAKPGGSWLSFGGGIIKVDGKVIRIAPVHGAHSAPWNTYATEEQTSSSLVLSSGSDGTGEFFRPDERYAVERQFMAFDGVGGCEGEIVAVTTITNVSEQSFDLLEAAEHTYYISGPDAAFVNHEGNLISVSKGIAKPHEANDNAIDVRISSDLTAAPGRCVFLPHGATGNVVVIDAVYMGPDGNINPVDTFCVYRFRNNDPWTAIEPMIGGEDVDLRQNQSISLVVSIRSFANIEEYRNSLAASHRPG